MEAAMRGNTINIDGELLCFDVPKVMGILNLTPDSFVEDSRKQTEAEIACRVEEMLAEGADIIDVGAVSTRPGAAFLSEEEEWERLSRGLKIIREAAPRAILSVDTFRASVARKCVETFHVGIVNDVSGGTDEMMFRTVAELHVPYVLTHSQGAVDHLHESIDCPDLLVEVMRTLAEKIYALRALGVKDIVLDPGFGFGKTLEQNYELFACLDEFRIFELPLLVGVSRKSMVYRLLGTTPAEALNGTTALHALALEHGADMLRVHDVREAVEAVRICEEIRKYQ